MLVEVDMAFAVRLQAETRSVLPTDNMMEHERPLGVESQESDRVGYPRAKVRDYQGRMICSTCRSPAENLVTTGVKMYLQVHGQ